MCPFWIQPLRRLVHGAIYTLFIFGWPVQPCLYHNITIESFAPSFEGCVTMRKLTTAVLRILVNGQAS